MSDRRMIGRTNPDLIGLDEFARFRSAHPEVRYVDALISDMSNVVRGKRLPVEEADKLFVDGIQMPYTLYCLDVTGDCSDPCGRGFSDGDPDGTHRPLAGTLALVPWAAEPTAQVLTTMFDESGPPSRLDPRNVLADLARRFGETKLTPVCAVELEFYLFDPERLPDGAPQPPLLPGTRLRDRSRQAYSMDGLDAYRGFIVEVQEACRVQGVPASAAATEFAPAQFEVNLHHVADICRAADHAVLLRRIVKGIARRHGVDASFMAKPYSGEPGNGMHIHLSLLDEAGRNLFDDGSEVGSALLRNAIGGLLATQHEAMAIFAPNINSFRRFASNLFTPVNRSWTVNNRSAAVRVPSGSPAARRLEHRIAGADANPYLVLAAVLAGVLHGLEHRLDPGEPWTGNASAELDSDLPFSVPAALDALAAGTVLPELIGRDYVDLYVATKRAEYAKFMAHVSPLEYEWYL